MELEVEERRVIAAQAIIALNNVPMSSEVHRAISQLERLLPRPGESGYGLAFFKAHERNREAAT